ncbi:hypothetical protein TNCV_3874641 [Trichonephila clavipes]|nr:hypothetical protein TNCV_3874641 [Trichonephila clavipes]
MLIYELPASSLKCRAQPNVIRRSFEPHDQMLYHRTILEPPHGVSGSRLETLHCVDAAKTVFGLDIIPEMMLPSSWRMDLTWGILDKGNALIKRLTSYLLRPRLMHLLRQTNDLWNKSPSLFQKEKSGYRTHHQTVSGFCEDYQTFHCLGHPQPVSIPEPPERTTPQILLPDPPPERTTPQILLPGPPPERLTPQILLPDPPVPTTPQILLPDPPLLTTPQILVTDTPVPTTLRSLLPDPPPVPTTPQILLPDPPVVKTLEPTFTDDSSVDQILSSVFGDYLQQRIPLAHTQEPQVLDTGPSLFDESNDLISFLVILKQGWP